jgi:hypothetical protein
MPSFGNIMTGLQIGGAVLGGLGTVVATKSLLDETLEILPYALAGIGMIGTVIIIVKFA